MQDVETLKHGALEAGVHGGLINYAVEEEDHVHVFQACECESCHETINSNDRSCQNEECDQYGVDVDYLEGPMSEYWYDLPLRSENEAMDVAEKLRDLSLCVVEVDGEYGLALTGTGWDARREICEAYMRAGFLPPVRIARQLPTPGSHVDEVDAWVAAGCRRSLDVEIGALTYDREHLDKLIADMSVGEPEEGGLEL